MRICESEEKDVFGDAGASLQSHNSPASCEGMGGQMDILFQLKPITMARQRLTLLSTALHEHLLLPNSCSRHQQT